MPLIEPIFDESHQNRVMEAIIAMQIESIMHKTTYVTKYTYEERPTDKIFGMSIDLTLYINEKDYMINRLMGGDRVEDMYKDLGFGVYVTIIIIKDGLI